MNNLTEEKITSSLCSLYSSYGYGRFKMNKFEQYSLYLENKDFIASDRVVTFTDSSGKLMALKPDVTLSIVKSAVDKKCSCEKVYYNENVYRPSKDSGELRELTQIGVESIGKLDIFALFEVIALAHKSLSLISDDYLLAVSHMGFLSAALEDVTDGEKKNAILDCISKRNLHSLRDILADSSVDEKLSKCLMTIASVYGDLDNSIKLLEAVSLNAKTDKAISELKKLARLLQSADLYDKTVVDLSIVNDMNYYNGVTFQGFVNTVAQSVLSGGEYGKLLEKLNSNLDAVGFAVYIDTIERLTVKKTCDADVLVLYSNGDENYFSRLKKCVDDLVINEKLSVRCSNVIPENIKCKKIMKFDGEVLKDVE